MAGLAWSGGTSYHTGASVRRFQAVERRRVAPKGVFRSGAANVVTSASVAARLAVLGSAAVAVAVSSASASVPRPRRAVGRCRARIAGSVERPVDAATKDFKRFLLLTEAEQPWWYMLSDLYLTVVGAFCFYMSVVEPALAEKYSLSQVEDFINVNFFIKFVLLFWSNDFESSWLTSGKVSLDLVSCLPMLKIPARMFGGLPLEKTLDLLQLARFLRLLRDTLPSSEGSSGIRGKSPLQIVTVLFAILGTITVSATLLFLYENPLERGPSALRGMSSFDDAVLYMVDIFAGRDVPFYAQTPGGKQVTAAATLVSILYVPFLISESVGVFLGPGAGAMAVNSLPGSLPPKPGAPEPPLRSVAYWAAVLQRLDTLAERGLISSADAQKLRKLCLSQQPQLNTLDLVYGTPCNEVSADSGAWVVYGMRLQELVISELRDEPQPPKEAEAGS